MARMVVSTGSCATRILSLYPDEEHFRPAQTDIDRASR